MTHISEITPRNDDGSFTEKGTWCSKEQVLELIKTYKTRNNYRHAIRCGADIPSVNRIEKWYGSWMNARNAANVTAADVNRAKNKGGCYYLGVPTAWYFLYFPIGNYYKTGITIQTLKERFGFKYFNEFEIIEVRAFDCGSEAYAFEQKYNEWLDNRPEVERLKERPYWDTGNRCGWTECFYLKSS
jgi:hypothetical protein